MQLRTTEQSPWTKKEGWVNDSLQHSERATTTAKTAAKFVTFYCRRADVPDEVLMHQGLAKYCKVHDSEYRLGHAREIAAR
jgi:hypothetical protein